MTSNTNVLMPIISIGLVAYTPCMPINGIKYRSLNALLLILKCRRSNRQTDRQMNEDDYNVSNCL